MEQSHANCPCMETCPLNRALSLIGGKWKMQILCSLHNNGTSRYSALRKSLDGVSGTVLAAALRELERDGLVFRSEYLEVPVRVEYSLTPRAKTLMPILDALGDWSMKELF
ncbi:MAG: helix-turn-helix transcriptional regulator [Clostridia bacterium]|nr:helix-turn-helix transcriptional regulator [Clostridia bacterium]